MTFENCDLPLQVKFRKIFSKLTPESYAEINFYVYLT